MDHYIAASSQVRKFASVQFTSLQRCKLARMRTCETANAQYYNLPHVGIDLFYS